MATTTSLISERVAGVLLAAAAFGGAAAFATLVVGDQARLAVAMVGAALTVLAAVGQPRAALVGTLVYLAVMAEVRRLLLPWLGWSGSDPLLLVGPVVVGALMLSLILSRRIVLDTPLSKAVAVLMAVMGLQILNPEQGGLLVGVAGALFYVVPLLWYWLGREYGSEALAERLLLRGVVPLAGVGALYGLVQFFRGLPAHQQMWIDVGAAPDALYTAFGVIKPFGFSEAPQVLATLAMAGIVIAAAYLLQQRKWKLLVWIPAIVLVLFVIASRGPWVRIAGALAMAWAVRAATPVGVLGRLAPAGVAMLFLIVTTFQAVQQAEFEGALAAAATHQADGLLNPLDAEASSAGVHAAMMRNGLLSPLTQPLGAGLGATTLAASKYGGAHISSEIDISDLFYSLGVFGLLYVAVIGYVFALVYRRWRATRSAVALAILLLLVATFGSWLSGQAYFVTALLWFLVGSLEHEDRQAETDPAVG